MYARALIKSKYCGIVIFNPKIIRLQINFKNYWITGIDRIDFIANDLTSGRSKLAFSLMC
jgi:hypothetical protein